MISEIGDWIGLLGIAALLYENTNLAVAASASLAALYLPYLFAPHFDAEATEDLSRRLEAQLLHLA